MPVRHHCPVDRVSIHLLAGKNSVDDRVMEAVPATPLDEPSTFVLAATPGLAQGTAAQDIVRVHDDGSFEVVRRGGNLAVHVLARGLGDGAYAQLEADVERLGGYLDGGADTEGATVRVFTIPVTAGFPAVEAAFDSFVTRHPQAQWFFGNVYDPADGVSSLNWWGGP